MSRQDRRRTVWRKGELRRDAQEAELDTKQVTFQGILNINYHSCSPRREDSGHNSYHNNTPVVESKAIIHILRAWGKSERRKLTDWKMKWNGFRFRFHINRKKKKNLRKENFPRGKSNFLQLAEKRQLQSCAGSGHTEVLGVWPLPITAHGLTAGKLYLVYNRKAVQLFPSSGKTPALLPLPFWKRGSRSHRAGDKWEVRVAASEKHPLQSPGQLSRAAGLCSMD